MKKYHALIADIDGTLTPNEPHSLPSERVTKTIQTAIAQGKIISLASGRPYFLVQYLVHHLGLTSPLIVDNGAVIVDAADGTVLWEAVLDATIANEILVLARHFPLVRVSADTGGFDNPGHIPLGTKVRKVSVHDLSVADADALIATITNTYKQVTAVRAASYVSPDLIDVYFSDAHATKQHAIVELARLLDISNAEMIGIGDGYNDFPLLMACGLRLAMGNAVDELKAIADEVVPSVEDDGLAYVINKYLK